MRAYDSKADPETCELRRITNRQAADRTPQLVNTTQSGDGSNLEAPAEAGGAMTSPARHPALRESERVKWVALELPAIVAVPPSSRRGRPFRPSRRHPEPGLTGVSALIRLSLLSPKSPSAPL